MGRWVLLRGLVVAMAVAKTLAAADGEDRGREMGQLRELLTHDASDSDRAHMSAR